MRKTILTSIIMGCCMIASAQDTTVDSVSKRDFFDRLSVGGYGEITFSRNYFSDHVSR